MPGVGDRGLGWVGAAIARLPAAHRDANLSVRLASALIKLGTGTDEAIAGASAILNDAPRASTRLETEVLEYPRPGSAPSGGRSARL